MKPIIFNTEYVRAILEGRKTQTRRVIPKDIVNRFDICNVEGPIAYIDQATGDSYEPTDVAQYHPGDILWARETFCPRYFDDGLAAYKADYDKERIGDVVPEPKWRPPIHMARSAARLFLRVTDVRVERVQDITLGDIEREGLYCDPPYTREHYAYENGMRRHWIQLWDEINAKRGHPWESNPWVWVYVFERISEEDAHGSGED